MPRVLVDHARCFGFGRCVDEVPEVFAFGPEGKSVPGEVGEVPIDRLLQAAWACPRQAISILGDDGVELKESMEARQ